MKHRSLMLKLTSLGLLMVGFAIDLTTSREVVIAIVYNVPIALSSLLLSRRLTLGLVVLALVATVTAGYVNFVQEGLDTIALLNRGLAALSFLLLGRLTIMLRNATARSTRLVMEEARARREVALRTFTTSLSGPLHPDELLTRATSKLRALLEAESVVVVGVRDNRFALPRQSDPPASQLGRPGQLVPWAVLATPTSEPPVINARLDNGLLTVGRWRRQGQDNLFVLARRARAAQPPFLLSEALRSLEPLLERAVLLADLEAQRSELGRQSRVIRSLLNAFARDLRSPLQTHAADLKHVLDEQHTSLSVTSRHALEDGLAVDAELLELADALAFVARFESGEPLGAQQASDFVALLGEAKTQLEPALCKRRVKLELEAPEHLPLRAYPEVLRYALQDIVRHAVRCSPAGSTVRLQVQKGVEGDGLRLEVRDQSSDDTGRPLERLLDCPEDETGLGLYLAREIIVAHGGQLEYTRRPGGGARLLLGLPTSQLVAA